MFPYRTALAFYHEKTAVENDHLRFVIVDVIHEVVLGGAHLRTITYCHWITAGIADSYDSAVITHLDDIDLCRVLDHGMFALKLGNDTLDSALGAKWLAARNALKGFFFPDGDRLKYKVGDIVASVEFNNSLRTGCQAETALNAGYLIETKRWPFLVSAERTCRA